MLNFYQNLPQLIDPIAFLIGSFSIRWYSLGYLMAFVTAFCILSWRINRRESFQKKTDIFIGCSQQKSEKNLEKKEIYSIILDIFIFILVGLLIGGRLGYVLFYNFKYFWQNPLAIFWPFQNGIFVGLFGMSYFGALLGGALAAFGFSKIKKINFWKMADFFAPAVAGGYFFGRLGNFFNGELLGRPTEHFWGMYFAGETFLRHPSPLYEAMGEGILLFLFLWLIRNRAKFEGQIFLLYIGGYCLIRFILEFWRLPDFQLGLFFLNLTLNQILALILFFTAAIVYFQKNKKMLELSGK